MTTAGTPLCPKHKVPLICPACRSAKGGKTTARRFSPRQLSKWGKLGGRPRKNPAEKAEN